MGIFSTVVKIEPVKPAFNIGAGFDIPTATPQLGKHGETILNGGYTIFNGFAGTGNTFKSTIADWCQLAAMERVYYGSHVMPEALNYDTEVNKNESHLKDIASALPSFRDNDPFTEGTFVVTDKTKYSGNKFFETMKDALAVKRSLGEKEYYTTPFLNRDGKTNLMILPPSFGSIDSLTEFETDAEREISKENELGDSGANTIFMKSGLFKTRFLMELSPIIHNSSHFITMVAQIGKEVSIQTGPMPAAPAKSLAAMKNGEVMKSVTSKFSFLTSILYQPTQAKGLFNGSRIEDGPLYPLEKTDKELKNKNDNDLFEVTLKCLRNKNGPTAFTMTVIVSQSEGVMRELTEFHFIKERRYGFNGNMQNYQLVLLPDVNLSRTTVRRKLMDSYELRRAVNILAELLQLRDIKSNLLSKEELLCTPEELYEDLKKLGYDWNVLLNTRGWWTVNNDSPDLIPFLSIIDLLRMRKGLYFPYWMDEKTKKLKDAYQNYKEYK